MADRFLDNFFGYGMQPPVRHPLMARPKSTVGSTLRDLATATRTGLAFAPGGGVGELADTQRAYQEAKEQVGGGNYRQAIVPGIYATLGGLDAVADLAMLSGAVVPPLLWAGGAAKLFAKTAKGAMRTNTNADFTTAAEPVPVAEPVPATDLDPSGFYSPTRRAIENLPQETGGGAQFAAMLRKAGAKQKEMDDTGISKLLEQETVTKNELIDAWQSGGVRLEETWKYEGGRKRDPDEFGWMMQEALEQGDMAEVQRLDAEWEQGHNPARWGQHVIEGGSNYKELLLRTPDPLMPNRMATEAERSRGYAIDEYGNTEPVENNMVKQNFGDSFRGGHDPESNVLIRVRMDDRHDLTGDGSDSLFIQELQSDWHLEGRQRGYRTGPRFSGELSAKEVDLGPGSPPRQIWEIRDENDTFITNVTSLEAKSADDALDVARYRISTGDLAVDQRVPDAPLKGVWADTAMRRIIHEAAKKPYGSISWTSGRMQQDRYDLSEHIDNIEVRRVRQSEASRVETARRTIKVDHPANLFPAALQEEGRQILIQGPNGRYELTVDRDGTVVGSKNFRGMVDFYGSSRHLREFVGDELSQKIMAPPIKKKGEGLTETEKDRLRFLIEKTVEFTKSEKQEYDELFAIGKRYYEQPLVVLEDVDFRMGGKWAENLYDKQMVNAANKWAKKHGGKVRKIDVGPVGHGRSRNKFEGSVWVLEITPKMRTASLLEGMPLYGAAGAGILSAAATRGVGETEREAY
jgi:hypothetical protein